MTRKRRASSAASSNTTPSKRRRYPGDIKYVPKKYVGSDVYKFMLKINEKLDLSTVDLRPFRFLRTIQNGVCIYQHLYNMGTDDPVQIVEPTSSAYTPAQLVKNDLSERVFATTGGTIDVKYFVDLVKKRSLDDDDMENLCNSLDSCFFVYPFYSEHTIHEEYDHVIEMINDWYQKHEDTPTLIAFVIRNTFNFIIWKAVYDHNRQTTDLFELVTDEEVVDDGSTPIITDDDEDSKEEYEDADGNRVSKFDAIYCNKCWKRVVKSESGSGYEYELDENDQIIYYRWDMAPVASEYYQVTYHSEDQQPYYEQGEQSEYLDQQQVGYHQEVQPEEEHQDQPSEYQVAYYYQDPVTGQQYEVLHELQQDIGVQDYGEQQQQNVNEEGEQIQVYHEEGSYEQQTSDAGYSQQQQHIEQYDEKNPEGTVPYVVAGDATVVPGYDDSTPTLGNVPQAEHNEASMENLPDEEQSAPASVEDNLANDLPEKEQRSEQDTIQLAPEQLDDKPVGPATATESAETTSTAPSPTTDASTNKSI